MLKINFNFKSFYFPIVCLVAVSLFGLVAQYTSAQHTSNTTVCINKDCTTTICVNDQPCKTTKLNSTNTTSLDDLLQNKTIPPHVLPGEIV
jgi:hypothetical protein